MDPEAYKKYNKPEVGSGAGIYKHEGTEEELWCSNHPQADAAVRQGWVRDRDLPSAEEMRKRNLLPANEQSLDEKNANEKAGNKSDNDEVARLLAENKALKSKNTKLENKLSKTAPDGGEVSEGKDDATDPEQTADVVGENQGTGSDVKESEKK